jgi:hypothetical protein
MMNDYLYMAELIARATVYKFCQAIIWKFGLIYWRAQNEEGTTRILEQNAARGFPEMLGSIDYMH